MTEEQIESHLVGVVVAQQCSMKRARELFGDKADATEMRELNQIHDFETYAQIKAGDLVLSTSPLSRRRLPRIKRK